MPRDRRLLVASAVIAGSLALLPLASVLVFGPSGLRPLEGGSIDQMFYLVGYLMAVLVVVAIGAAVGPLRAPTQRISARDHRVGLATAALAAIYVVPSAGCLLVAFVDLYFFWASLLGGALGPHMRAYYAASYGWASPYAFAIAAAPAALWSASRALRAGDRAAARRRGLVLCTLGGAGAAAGFVVLRDLAAYEQTKHALLWTTSFAMLAGARVAESELLSSALMMALHAAYLPIGLAGALVAFGAREAQGPPDDGATGHRGDSGAVEEIEMPIGSDLLDE